MEKVTILIHGFKSQGHDDFAAFVEYAKDKVDHELEMITYYDNNDKKTLKWRKWKDIIAKEIKKHEGKHINIVGYSMGSLAGIAAATQNEDIKSIYAAFPAYKIVFFDWIFRLRDNAKKAKEIKKRLGKERYKRMKRLKKSGVSEKHPLRIVWNMNVFKTYNRKFLKKLKGKNLHITYSITDEIVHVDKTRKFIDKNLDLKSNNVTKEQVELSHYTALYQENTELYDSMINFINNN